MATKLKDAIVIKNQFTNVKNSKYGKTPGAYIKRYGGRTSATEILTPLKDEKYSSVDFIMKYMARDDATEVAIDLNYGPELFSDKLANIEKQNGRTFGNDSLSYSDDTLTENAKKVQQAWDDGHTVMKTVISFRTEYLKDLGVIPKDVDIKSPGDLKGAVDQLKLRHAISSGVNKMTKSAGFDKPLWIGAIQVDRLHAHVHLVITEVGKKSSNIINGEERGKLNSSDKRIIRQGIDYDLRQLNPLKSLHAQVDVNRRNITSRIKHLMSSEIKKSSKLQQLYASLPVDKKLWRWNSNSKVMQHSNDLMLTYIDEMKESSTLDNAYTAAQESIYQYAVRRHELYDDNIDKLIENGTDLLNARIANAVYSELSEYDNVVKTTPYMRAVAKSPDDIRKQIIVAKTDNKKDDDLEVSMFSYRLHQYRHRRDKHSKKEHYYQDSVEKYDKLQREHKTTLASKAMRKLYEVMRLHHAKLTDKYRYLFGVDDSDIDAIDTFKTEQKYLMDYYEFIDGLEPNESDANTVNELLNDSKLDSVLDMPLGSVTIRQLAEGTVAFDASDKVVVDALHMIEKADSKYEGLVDILDNNNKINDYEYYRSDYMEKLTDFNRRARSKGLVTFEAPLNDSTGFVPPQSLDISEELKKSGVFAKVKGLDLADIQYDFDIDEDRRVSDFVIESYKNDIDIRVRSYENAISYLRETNQSFEPIADIKNDIDTDLNVYDVVNVTKHLPMAVDINMLDDTRDERILETVDFYEANEIRKNQIKVVTHLVRDVSFNLDNNTETNEKDIEK